MGTYTEYTLLYGIAYANEFEITDYVLSFTGGLPSLKYNQTNIMSHGSNLSKVNFLTGYNGKMTLRFIGSDLVNRHTFISIIMLPQGIPCKLRRTQTISGSPVTDEIECRIQLNEGESYETLFVKSQIEINILSEYSFFSKTTLTTHNETLSSTIPITNAGLNVYPNFEFTLSAAGTYIDMKTAEGYGFRIEYNFVATDVIEVLLTRSSLIIYVNDGLVQNVLSSGSSPFEIPNGSVTLYYSGPAGSVDITYYETRL